MSPLGSGALRALRALPALFYGLAILYGGVVDLGPLPETPSLPSDKVLHLLAFMGFEIMAELALAPLEARRRRRIAVLASVGLGLGLELVQATLPHRSAEVFDLVADTLGAFLGAALVALALRVFGKRGAQSTASHAP